MQVETVKIVRGDSPRGFRIIAASDFDEKVHTLFDGAATAAPSTNKTTAKPRPKRKPRKATAEK